MQGKLCVFSSLLLMNMILVAHAGPLHDASKIGDTNVISDALEKGADVNESDGISTPLYLAVAGNHVEAAKLLVAKGADANLSAKWGPPASLAAGVCNAEPSPQGRRKSQYCLEIGHAVA
jgi:cytochrome c